MKILFVKKLLLIGLILVSFSLGCRRELPTPQRGLPDSTQGEQGSTATGSHEGPMERIWLPNAQERGAVCNDGTPAAYYFRPGIGDGLHRWVIHLQGGGFCYSKVTCQARTTQEAELMTSNDLPKTRKGDGILSASPDVNPGFATANHVFISYCSSDVWSGDQPGSSVTDGLHFRGVSIFRAVIEDLMDPDIIPSPNLAEATEVLFSGTSAGGVGVLTHLDWLAAKLPSAQVKGVDDAGWFIIMSPFVSSLNSPEKATQLAYQYWHGSTDETCATAHAGKEGQCYLGAYVYPYLTTPLFVQISQLDGPQLNNLGITLKLDAEERQYVNGFRAAVRTSLMPVSAAFSPAEQLHGLLVNSKFNTVTIDGYSLNDLLMNWFFDRPGPVKLLGE